MVIEMGKANKFSLEVIKATVEQKPILANLLELYAYDFTEYCDFDIGDNGFYGYEYLPFYWTDPNRFPYLIYINGKLAGFVLVQKGSPISKEIDVWDISEFFIMKKYKRHGIGTAVAQQIWDKFHGNWQVRVLVKNHIACSFWLGAIKKFINKIPLSYKTRIEEDDWIVYRFESN